MPANDRFSLLPGRLNVRSIVSADVFSWAVYRLMLLGWGDRAHSRTRRPVGSTYAIGLWGDLPYSDTQALVGVPNLIADMNAQKLAFTVHDGDLKAGNGTPDRRRLRLAAMPFTCRRSGASTR